MNTSCELCSLDKLTKWFFETDNFVVCDCKTCGIPMYVWRKHSFPTDKQIQEMVEHAARYFPDKRVDLQRRKIPDHFHFHCR